MKVALVTTNLRGGGAEKVFLRIAELLPARGHEVHLVLLEDIVDHVVCKGVRLHALTSPGRPCSKGFLGKRVAARRLRRCHDELARDGAFDLVMSTLPFADEVAALAGLPRLWHRIANTLSEEVEKLHVHPAKARRRLARYRRLYGGANLVAISQGVADDLREGLGLTHANVERLYNPFDFAQLRKLAAEPAVGVPDEPYAIHVGRFVPQKRHDLLLDAWQRAGRSEALVLLVHPHPRLDELIAARGLAGRVTVAGFQPNPYPWIARARLLVLCSDHEGLGNVLVEALACGTPVVSTDCPSGPREILGAAGSRWLVPCDDATALARAIGAALDAPPDLAGFDLERFDARTVAAQLEALPGRWRAPRSS